jgi:tetratricopeptide (TPR) repeat protein
VVQKTKTFEDGDVVFREGDPGGSGYVIVKGKVALSKDTSRGQVEIEVLGKSASFGEVGVMNGGLRTLSATAVGQVTVELVEQSTSESAKIAAPRSTSDVPSPDGAAPLRVQGWLSRLFNMVGNKSRFIEVRVVPFHGEGGAAFAKSAAYALGQCEGIRVKMINRAGPFAQKTIAKANIGACIGEGRKLLRGSSGDLLIWGTMSPLGTSANLHMVSGIPHDEDMPGSFNGFNEFPLSTELTDPWIALLNAVVLAVTVTDTPEKTQVVQANLEAAIEEGAPIAQKPPRDMSTTDRANLLICLGNAISIVSQRLDEVELIDFATGLYRQAIALISSEDHTMLWGMAHKQMGSILYMGAERRRDDEKMREAADAFEIAIDTIPRRHLPREWAAAQNRFGLSLYKLDLADALADTQMLKSSITAYCAALQVYTRVDAPQRWADVMNNYALVAQVLGDHMREPKILQKAVSACRSALEVRQRNRTPHLWASTQNTLGSALFLLGKVTGREDYLDSAIDAFQASYKVYLTTGAKKNATVIQRNLDRVAKLRDYYRTRKAKEAVWSDVGMTDRNDADWWRDNVVDDAPQERFMI